MGFNSGFKGLIVTGLIDDGRAETVRDRRFECALLCMYLLSGWGLRVISQSLSTPVLPSSVLIVYLCLFCRLSYITYGIGKGKFHSISGHEDPEGE